MPKKPTKPKKKKLIPKKSVYTHSEKLVIGRYAGTDLLGVLLTPKQFGFKPDKIKWGTHVKNDVTVQGSTLVYTHTKATLFIKVANGFYSFTLQPTKGDKIVRKPVYSIREMQEDLYKTVRAFAK